MDVFGLAALATIVRFIFWFLEKMIKTLGEIARRRRTMQEERKVPGELIEGSPRD